MRLEQALRYKALVGRVHGEEAARLVVLLAWRPAKLAGSGDIIGQLNLDGTVSVGNSVGILNLETNPR